MLRSHRDEGVRVAKAVSKRRAAEDEGGVSKILPEYEGVDCWASVCHKEEEHGDVDTVH